MSNLVKLEATNGRVVGLIPRSLEEIYKLSETIFKSGLAPNGTRSADQVAVSILHGLEVGLPPLQAVQKVAVINGRPSLWGDAVPALLWAKGFKLNEYFDGDGEKQVAVCEIIRPDGQVIKRSFSVDDAKRARLWGKQGPWSQYPSRMLQMRARSFAARDGASECLSGLYLAEEALDIPPPKNVDATVVDVATSEVVSDAVSYDQCKQILDLFEANPDVLIAKFLEHFDIASVVELPASRFDEALSLINKSIANRQKKKGGKQ